MKLDGPSDLAALQVESLHKQSGRSSGRVARWQQLQDSGKAAAKL